MHSSTKVQPFLVRQSSNLKSNAHLHEQAEVGVLAAGGGSVTVLDVVLANVNSLIRQTEC